MDGEKYPYLAEYLKKNRLKIKLSIYYSGMVDFVGDMYMREGKMVVKGALISSERASTFDQLLIGMDSTAKLLLEAETAK